LPVSIALHKNRPLQKLLSNNAISEPERISDILLAINFLKGPILMQLFLAILNYFAKRYGF